MSCSILAARTWDKTNIVTGYGLIAPVLTEINADIGPSANINWVPLANICCGAVFFLMVGQLSDIFGELIDTIPPTGRLMTPFLSRSTMVSKSS